MPFVNARQMRGGMRRSPMETGPEGGGSIAPAMGGPMAPPMRRPQRPQMGGMRSPQRPRMPMGGDRLGAQRQLLGQLANRGAQRPQMQQQQRPQMGMNRPPMGGGMRRY